eukprot:scaffold6261_cov28-Tisochrysis_lutea.AAC.6
MESAPTRIANPLSFWSPAERRRILPSPLHSCDFFRPPAPQTDIVHSTTHQEKTGHLAAQETRGARGPNR